MLEKYPPYKFLVTSYSCSSGSYWSVYYRINA